MKGYACVPCQVLLRPSRNGVFVGITDDSDKVVSVWMADEWQCPTCGHRSILGYGNKPVALHYEDHFEQELRTVDVVISGKLYALP